MKHFSEIPLLITGGDREWLVLGKGPSFSKFDRTLLSNYISVALNHAVAEVEVDIAHAIDIDVVADCQESIEKNAKFLLMPLHPHIKFAPTEKQITDFLEDIPLLRKLDAEGRLYWYNSSTWKAPNPAYPVVPVCFFSADAVVALLAFNGIRKIRTVGIDGGTVYAESFRRLEDKTLLKNGQPAFNLQFRAIAKTLKSTGTELLPMDMDGPIWVFVGSQNEQMLAVKVLEYSIMKNASCSVKVIPLHENNVHVPLPRDEKNKPRTPFSFQRFLIPHLRGYRGRAIYLDSDMQVFCNIRDLWGKEFNGANVLSAWLDEGEKRKPQFSVMLLDCDALEWKIDEIVAGLDNGNYSYEELMYEMVVAKVAPCIEPEWNSLERFEEGKTKLLHYTDMNEQPWLTVVNPLRDIWVRELAEAISDDFISMEYVVETIAAQDVRPSLFFELNKKQYKGMVYKLAMRYADRWFVPPHKRENFKRKSGSAKRCIFGAMQGVVIRIVRRLHVDRGN